MGLYDQPNSWQCGPFALKHGLLSYGIFAHEDTLATAAGSTAEAGTDDHQLAMTAREYGCVLSFERYRTAHRARRALARLLAARTPVLLCLDQWDHWVTAVGADDTHVVLFDSHYDTVVRVESWSLVLQRLGYRRRVWRWGPTLRWYDLHPLGTRGEPALRLTLTVERARRLLDAPASFRRALDDYARRLVPFVAHNGRRSAAFALAPWLLDGGPSRTGVMLAPQAVEPVAFTAELFDVRCELPAAQNLARMLAEKSAEPTGIPPRAFSTGKTLAAAS
jgi:hypothetical protein